LTDAEARERERNRVAWNLPRSPRAVPSAPRDETPNVTEEVRESADRTAEDV
jgi:hypothetical protein